MEPAARRKRLTDAGLALTLRGAQLRPLILVYEDLQWSDTSTAELLDALMDLVAGVPLLMIQTHRVGYTPPFGRRSFYTTLCLQNLSHTDTRALASSLLGTETLPEALIPLLREQTEGVPLYLEEIIKTLLDTGALRPENNGYRLALRQHAMLREVAYHSLLLRQRQELHLRTSRLRRSFLAAPPVLEVYEALGHRPPSALP